MLEYASVFAYLLRGFAGTHEIARMNWLTFSAIVQAGGAIAIAVLTFFLVRATRDYVRLTKQLAEAAARPIIAARLNLQGLVYPIVEDLKRLPRKVGMDCSQGDLPSEEQMREVIRLASYCDERALTNAGVAESHIAVLRPRLSQVRARPGKHYGWESWRKELEIAIGALELSSSDEVEMQALQIQMLESLDETPIPEVDKEKIRGIIRGRGEST